MDTTRRRFLGLLPAGLGAAALAPFVAKAESGIAGLSHLESETVRVLADFYAGDWADKLAAAQRAVDPPFIAKPAKDAQWYARQADGSMTPITHAEAMRAISVKG